MTNDEHLLFSAGCTLLFYETYGKASSDQEMSPCYALVVDDGIVQAVPEHPKKENVFCLSNVYGDVYLFQVSCKTWVLGFSTDSLSPAKNTSIGHVHHSGPVVS